KGWAFAPSVKAAPSSTAGRGSASAARSRSIPTAASSPAGAPTALATSTKPARSSGAGPASARSDRTASRPAQAAAGRLAGRFSLLRNRILELDFYYTTTACSLASHIGLEEAGAPFNAHFVKLYRDEEKAAYRQIVPTGKVPALRVDGAVITENVAILTFLAQAFPESRLLPEDPVLAAQGMALMSWLARTGHRDRR